ncbi:YchJ family protein [Sulfurospirillum arcachonense]|uniref:YchJ family protein n=1 Tax=Sulfurospirillum arcachonense TaxID=57666 RepID=UPI00046A51FD|nr:YchJ family metal-binding protein [Sulfurospirillum arcachonense]
MTINSKCPCGSGEKYKKCCNPYHKGKIAQSALLLMKSRYSAFVYNEYKYIINTTHSTTRDTNIEAVKNFSKQTKFENLQIIHFEENENEAYVTFKATLFSNSQDISFTEKSKFLKENNKWYYVNGEFI